VPDIVLVLVLVLVLDAVVLFSISRTSTTTRTIGTPSILGHGDVVSYKDSADQKLTPEH